MSPKGGVAKRFRSSLGDDVGGEGGASGAASSWESGGGVGASGAESSGSASAPYQRSSRRRFEASRDVVPPPSSGDLRAAAKSGESGPRTVDPFTEDLKEDWGRGKISSVRALQYARGSSAQGARNLEDLAKAATGGKHPQNAQRDLMRVWGPAEGAPPISWIEIPTSQGNLLHPFFLPHLFFGSLYAALRPIFDAHVSGPLGAARKY